MVAVIQSGIWLPHDDLRLWASKVLNYTLHWKQAQSYWLLMFWKLGLGCFVVLGPYIPVAWKHSRVMDNWVGVFACFGQMQFYFGWTPKGCDRNFLWSRKGDSHYVMLNTLYLTVGIRYVDTLLLSHGWPAPSKDKAFSCLPKTQSTDWHSLWWLYIQL